MIRTILYILLGMFIGLMICGFIFMLIELRYAQMVEEEFDCEYTPPERTVTIEGYEDE